MADKKKKFVVGEAGVEKELMRAVRKDNPDLRVIRNCEIRIRNHVAEIKKMNIKIDDFREEIRIINAEGGNDTVSRITDDLRKDILGSEIRGLIKWRRHLRVDIKFLNNQKSILASEKRSST